MTQKILAWAQLIVLIGGGLIAWGRMTQRLDDLQSQVEKQHTELMEQMARTDARILAIETEVFRTYSGGKK